MAGGAVSAPEGDATGRPVQGRFEIPLRPGQGHAVEAALAPEAAEGPEGSRIHLELEDDRLRITLQASDVSTLRASMHSMLRLTDAAARVA